MLSLAVNPGLLKPCGDSGVGDSCPFLSYCGGYYVFDCGLGVTHIGDDSVSKYCVHTYKWR